MFTDVPVKPFIARIRPAEKTTGAEKIGTWNTTTASFGAWSNAADLQTESILPKCRLEMESLSFTATRYRAVAAVKKTLATVKVEQTASRPKMANHGATPMPARAQTAKLQEAIKARF